MKRMSNLLKTRHLISFVVYFPPVFVSAEMKYRSVCVYLTCCREKDKLKEREEKWNQVVKQAQSNPAVSSCSLFVHGVWKKTFTVFF